jgi:hypothetical protein
MQYWSSEENQQTIVFELPEKFSWVNWGKQYQHTSPDMIFFSNLNQHGNKLIYADRFTIYTDEFLTDAAYQNYRQCLLTMSELANQWIILEKREPKADTVPVASDSQQLTPPDNPTASETAPASATPPMIEPETATQG